MFISQKGCDLYYLQKQQENFSCFFVFFNNHCYDSNDLHLLEHLLLSYDRHLPSTGKTFGELISLFTEVNGTTYGGWMDLNFSSHFSFAIEGISHLVNLTVNDLVIDQDQMEREKKIIKAEFANNPPTINLFNPMEETMKYMQGEIMQIHNDVVKSQKPLTILIGDVEKVGIKKIMETLKPLNERNVTEYNYLEDTKYGIYNPIQQGEKNQGFTLFFSNEVNSIKEYLCCNIFYYWFYEYCFHYVRMISGIDYDVKSNARNVGKKIQLIYKFLSQDTIEHILGEYRKNVTLEKFEDWKKRTYYNLLRDFDGSDQVYQIAQTYQIFGKPYDAKTCAENIKNISLDDYLNLLKKIFDSYSIRGF